MKILILYLTCCLLSALSLQGAPTALKPSIAKPPYPDLIKESKYSACALKTFLEQGKLEEFYKTSKKILKENGRIEDKDMKQFQNELWIFYYIAAAPLFQIDESLEAPISWREDKTLDYDVKTTAARYMAAQDMDKLVSVLSIPKDTIIALHALYIAEILHSVAQSHDPDLEKKQKRQKIEQEEKNRQLYRERKIDFNQANLRSVLLHNRINTQDLRNNAAKMRKDSLEKTFLNLLIRYFPGNAAKVRKYIKLAGYSDKEIPGLIDRAIGRDSKTEFLYKGAGRKKGTRP